MSTLTYSDRGFPIGPDSEELSWDLGMYHTTREEREGFPRMRIVIRAMADRRPDQLAMVRRDLLRGIGDRLFGHNARTGLAIIDATLA